MQKARIFTPHIPHGTEFTWHQMASEESDGVEDYSESCTIHIPEDLEEKCTYLGENQVGKFSVRDLT